MTVFVIEIIVTTVWHKKKRKTINRVQNKLRYFGSELYFSVNLSL